MHFSCKCFILINGKDNLGKFDAKSDGGIFLSYSSTSKAYKVYNHITAYVEESVHVSFDESSPQKTRKGICSDVSGVIIERLIDNESSKEDPTYSKKDGDITEDKEESLHEDAKQETSNQLPQDWKIVRDYPLDQILGDIKRGASTRSHVNNLCKYSIFISQIQPKLIFDALLDEGWLFSIQEELIQFKCNDVQDLVSRRLIKPSLAQDGYLGIRWMKIM